VRGEQHRVVTQRSQSESRPHTGELFLKWNWDGATLTICNDRYGFFPGYYYVGDHEVMVSPSIEQLLQLGAPKEFDFDAIATIIHFSSYVGNDTAFASIRALPPAATLRWRPGHWKLTSSAKLPQTRQISYASAIDGYIELFRQAIARRLPDADFAIPLTGGRDSRHILFELNRLGYRPKFCITTRQYPPVLSDDVAVAAKLAEALGLRHEVVDPPKSRYSSEMAALPRSNYSANGNSQYDGILKHCCDNVAAIYDGLGGDVLSAGMLLTPDRVRFYESRNWQALMATLSSDDAVLRVICRPEILTKVAHDAAKIRVEKEMLFHADAGNPLTSFTFSNRTRRRIAQNTLANFIAIGTVHTPYLDHDLVDFLTSLPLSIVVKKTLHTDAIAKAFPEFGDIPFESDWRTRNDPWHFVRLSRELALSLVERPHSTLLRILPLLARFSICATLPTLAYRANFWAQPTMFLQALNRAGEPN
jgi:hypothetical protein